MDVWRILGLVGAGCEAGRPRGWRSNLRWFRYFALIHVAARSYLTVPPGPEADSLEQSLRWLIVVTALVGCIPRFCSWAPPLSAVGRHRRGGGGGEHRRGCYGLHESGDESDG